MSKKIRVGIVFGGKSAEHEVSLLSAKTVVESIDKEKYEIVLIGIDKEGQWHLRDAHQFLLHADDLKRVRLHSSDDHVVFVSKDKGQELVNLSNGAAIEPLDVIFPILHGPNGEDGTVQGLLKLVNIPFVGSGILSSAVAMDKDVSKRLFKEAGISTPKFLTVHRTKREQLDLDKVIEEFGLPLFVKPANLGSSVGVSKVKSKEDLVKAIDFAFVYDHKILIEEYIRGREFECCVLGNENPTASLIGEVIPTQEFYTYEAKYSDEAKTIFKIPVHLEEKMVKSVQELCIAAYEALCCEGMARVDCFMSEEGKLYVNEVNTIPGFTKLSMYPRLWEASGLPPKELIDKLIQLAIERSHKERALKTDY